MKLRYVFLYIYIVVITFSNCVRSSLNTNNHNNYNGVEEKNIDIILDKIRDDEASLNAFFNYMPKGGDLHHHYSGSIYAETYLNYAIEKKLFLNTSNFNMSNHITWENDWIPMEKIIKTPQWETYKEKILQKWSIKDLNFNEQATLGKHFFSTFSQFDFAVENTWKQGLVELKECAKVEHISYLETIFSNPKSNIQIPDIEVQIKKLQQYQSTKNADNIAQIFNTLFNVLKAKGIQKEAISFNKNVIEYLHNSLKLDDANFKIRYQNYVYRGNNPVNLFRDLFLAFESANTNNLVVGVNIVGPEYETNALQDYWLHMQMFKYFNKKYPNVKYSLHAGELTLGNVKPEDLNWHINEAVWVANANRVGHGVDISYENKCFDLLNYMSKKHIAVEINLFSNEVILGIKNNAHPINLYNKFNVPIVICSDDAGVLRSSLQHQFVLLAKRYPNISYSTIKEFVFNSIEYSFIKEDIIKTNLKQNLQKDFELFEQKIKKIFAEL